MVKAANGVYAPERPGVTAVVLSSAQPAIRRVFCREIVKKGQASR